MAEKGFRHLATQEDYVRDSDIRLDGHFPLLFPYPRHKFD